MNIIEIIERIRKKPEKTRKIILWSIVVPLGIFFSIWWINITLKSIKEIPENIKTPEIDTSSLEEIEKETKKIEEFFSDEEINKLIEEWEKTAEEEQENKEQENEKQEAE